MPQVFDYVVAGGGIVGLATARELLLRRPGLRLAVVEKERSWGAHQTGHNSGVIHSGLYYKPGTRKAALALAGNRSMVAFCRERDIPIEVCGKLIVATSGAEVVQLRLLQERGISNGVAARWIDAGEIHGLEPHAAGLAALHVPQAGIVDYRLVCDAIARELQEQGADLRLGFKVGTIRSSPSAKRIQSDQGEVLEARTLVACCGLQSDRVARLDGVDPLARIVPFRGEYWQLRPERRTLVRNLIYPVPDPAFPFLGVHLTRMIDGSVHAGPNAVFGLSREGYRKTQVSLRDLGSALGYPGFWRMAGRHAGSGFQEMVRSLSRHRFAESARRLVPGIQDDDLVPAQAGIRAQALGRDGSLVDDFLLVPGTRSLHVCNAPSPAATASLEIAKAIADALSS